MRFVYQKEFFNICIKIEILMEQNLVIVESPAKAKTIEKFLGEEFLVKSSFGHIRDLSKKEISVDVENNFEPNYTVSDDKKKIVNELKKDVKKAKAVWLASDEDREGEAIAWHLYEVLNLDKEKTKRIVFHEITKDAILDAIKTPRSIDKNLVDAQQARRVLDRLVGYELSPLLWKKVKPALSAGRVQSVAVRLIVEREREINKFKSSSAFRILGQFEEANSKKDKFPFKAELNKRLNKKEEVVDFLSSCANATYTVDNITKKPSKRSPAAPFTTSTLQQEASRKFGFSVAQTMAIAQKLYENGLITYMRTDSLNLSKAAVNSAISEIKGLYGEKYSKPRSFKTKTKGAQEAHEAIRPTYLNNHTIEGSATEQKLYELIWKRTIASQMSEAQLEKTTINIDISNSDYKFIATGEVIKFDGFLKVYMESTDDEESEKSEGLLPNLAKDAILDTKGIEAIQKFTNHPPRYTEASLVKKLEELGIGRPSTYAPTISTILNREYVVKEIREGKERKYIYFILKDGKVKEQEKKETTGFEKNKLFPTDIGSVVNDFLVQYFGDVIDYNFTANVEKMFDDIAEGKVEWQKMLKKFYVPFHKKIEHTIENSEKSSGERKLGDDPSTGKPIYVKIGRYGPMAQIGDATDEEKPRFARLLKGQSIETITLEETLELFKLPRELGEYEEKVVTIGIGRFGPYVRHDNKFVSLKKGVDDPNTIDLPRAIELILEKRETDKNKTIKTFEEDKELLILNGRYGPYISYKKSNYRIPKTAKPEDLKYEECKEIISKAGDKKKPRRTKK
jgi:DNA topoisomerase I